MFACQQGRADVWRLRVCKETIIHCISLQSWVLPINLYFHVTSSTIKKTKILKMPQEIKQGLLKYHEFTNQRILQYSVSCRKLEGVMMNWATLAGPETKANKGVINGPKSILSRTRLPKSYLLTKQLSLLVGNVTWSTRPLLTSKTNWQMGYRNKTENKTAN